MSAATQFGYCCEKLTAFVALELTNFSFISKARQFYEDGKPFTCLDGSKTIPFDRVNDDYCDCQDASDEPGMRLFHTSIP